MDIYTPSEIKECITLDKNLKEYLVRKSNLLRQKVSGVVNQRLLDETLKLNYETEEKFAKMKCVKKIEYLRLNEIAVLDLEQAIKNEKKISGENNKEQNIYILLGGIVLLVVFYILIKK